MTSAHRERARHRVRYEVDAAGWLVAEPIFNATWELFAALLHSDEGGDRTEGQIRQELRDLVYGKYPQETHGRLVLMVVSQIMREWKR